MVILDHPPTTTPTFYRSASDEIAARPATLACLVAFDRVVWRPDALVVLDTDPASDRYGDIVGWSDLPTKRRAAPLRVERARRAHSGHHGDDLHRRYLPLPGLRSSNIYVYDTQPDPRHQPTLARTVLASEVAETAGYSRRHTILRSRRDLPVLPGRRQRRERP